MLEGFAEVLFERHHGSPANVVARGAPVVEDLAHEPLHDGENLVVVATLNLVGLQWGRAAHFTQSFDYLLSDSTALKDGLDADDAEASRSSNDFGERTRGEYSSHFLTQLEAIIVKNIYFKVSSRRGDSPCQTPHDLRSPQEDRHQVHMVNAPKKGPTGQ